jgi:hemoglobin/transferrin/lactoferrin receptor protein
MPSVSRSPRLAFLLVCGTALAGPMGMTRPATAQSVAAQSFSFDIPARPLASAIAQVGAVTGWRIAYALALPAGATSAPLTGTMTAKEAVRRLIANTGLVYRVTGPRSIVLEARAAAAAAQAEDGSELLDTVDVTTATAPGDAPFQTPGSSNYISQEQIERLPPQSAGDMFIGTPGVISSMNRNGAAMDVNIRGLQGQNRVKVTIDGTIQATSTWRGYQGVDDRVYVDPDLIGGVDISKGPNDGADGAGVIGGVVGIRTLNAGDIVEEGKEYGVRVRAGLSDNGIDHPGRYFIDERHESPPIEDFENWSGSIAAGVRKENYDIVAAFARRQSGNYFAGTNGPTTYTLIGSNGLPTTYPLTPVAPGDEVFNTSQDLGSGLVKATLRFAEDQSIELGYMRYDNKYGEISPSVIRQGNNSWRQIGLSSTVVDTYTARYHWAPADNDLVDLRANIWATHIDEVTWYADPGPVFPPYYYPYESQRPNTVTTYGGDISNISHFDTEIGAIKLDYGGSYSLEDADGSTYTTDGHTLMRSLTGQRMVSGVYTNAELIATDWLKFNGGLRYDFYSLKDGADPAYIPPAWPIREFADQDGGRLNPTASVTVTPWKGIQLYALYTEGMRPPSLRETSFSDSLLYPNPDLVPEIARNWEFGLNVLRNDLFAGGDKLRLKVAYFNNNYEDYISRVMTAFPTVAYYTTRNIDKAKFSGIEVSGGYDAGFLFTEFSLNYYTNVEFCDDGKPCMGSSLNNDYGQNHVPPELTATLTLGMRAFENRLVMGARMNHVGSRVMPLLSNNDIATATWIPYTVVDLFGSYKLSENLTFNGSVENVGDRYYVDALANSKLPSPGRTIRVGLTGTF